MSNDSNHLSPIPSGPSALFKGTFFVTQLWLYSLSVLYPAQALKSIGWYPKNTTGNHPQRHSLGAGPLYSREFAEPVYLQRTAAGQEVEFDRVAGLYETVVSPATHPVESESMRIMRRMVGPAARVLDLSCGPGTELVKLAQLVPEGEVVGVDISAGMIKTAFAKARQLGFRNTAFFQADVAQLPDHFSGRFDTIHCSFAFHHYNQPQAAVREMHRVLNSNGNAFVLDNGTWWMNLIGSPFAKWADPGWVAFRTGEEFQQLFSSAGFSAFYWEEILPGVGFCIATK
jgi:ubiquinone/menaquinone biosynthesis C-methylase UbiE